jgi:D-serine deaminase-like pyridoxal phosphate-dependent protein
MKIHEIETPALLLDMDAMESNLRKMAAFFAQSRAKLRPHFKNHKCPALALRQLAAGAIGMTCATIAEADSLVRHGIRSVLIANEIADSVKIERFLDLASQADVMVCVDNESTVKAIAGAARTRGMQPAVLVDVDVGLHRCGVQPGQSAVRLAKFVLESGLRFRGLMGYEGRIRLRDGPEKEEACGAAMRLLVECRDLLEEAGIPVEIVSSGGTSSHKICGRYPGVTEVQAGSYLVMDTDYFQCCCTDFELALSLLTTIVSKTGSERIVVDAGVKALSALRGLSSVKSAAGVTLKALNAEHGIIQLDHPDRSLEVGDKIELWVHDADPTISLHRQIFGIRKDLVEEVFRIEG